MPCNHLLLVVERLKTRKLEDVQLHTKLLMSQRDANKQRTLHAMSSQLSFHSDQNYTTDVWEK